jgi:hypothetical protein
MSSHPRFHSIFTFSFPPDVLSSSELRTEALGMREGDRDVDASGGLHFQEHSPRIRCVKTSTSDKVPICRERDGWK